MTSKPRTARLVGGASLAVLLLSTTAGTAIAAGVASPPGQAKAAAVHAAKATQYRGKSGAAAAKGNGSLARAAAKLKTSAAELEKQMAADPSLVLDSNANTFYAENQVEAGKGGPTTKTGTTTTTKTSAKGSGGAVSNATPAPTQAEAFSYASKPGSQHTIYLNFLGATTTGTAWNTSYGVDPIVTAPLDFDGNPATFNTDELLAIKVAYSHIAERYAGFDVNVTTIKPAADQLVRTDTTDATWGTQVNFGKTPALYNACQCGGLGMVGAMTQAPNADVTSQFVFSEGVGNSGVNMGNAGAHEVGHTLGLHHHDYQPAGGTYQAYANNAYKFSGPIMGATYGGVDRWSKGEYVGSVRVQDDLALIAAAGLPNRTDDVPAGTSAPLSVGAAKSGRIETTGDVDAYTFTIAKATKATTVAVAVLPSWVVPMPGCSCASITPASALDAKVTLVNAAGAVVATADPLAWEVKYDANGKPVGVANTDNMNASVTTALAAGTYTVKVEGVGVGDTTTGVDSNYGSLGTYTLKVS